MRFQTSPETEQIIAASLNLSMMISKLLPHATVVTVGSFGSGLLTRCSDVDVLIAFSTTSARLQDELIGPESALRLLLLSRSNSARIAVAAKKHKKAEVKASKKAYLQATLDAIGSRVAEFGFQAMFCRDEKLAHITLVHRASAVKCDLMQVELEAIALAHTHLANVRAHLSPRPIVRDVYHIIREALGKPDQSRASGTSSLTGYAVLLLVDQCVSGAPAAADAGQALLTVLERLANYAGLAAELGVTTHKSEKAKLLRIPGLTAAESVYVKAAGARRVSAACAALLAAVRAGSDW